MGPNKKTIKWWLLLVGFGILFWWCLQHSDAFGAALKTLRSILTPFVLGFAVAFIVNLVLRPLERLWKSIWKEKKLTEKLRRPICLVLSYLIVLGIVFLVFFIILPQLGRTVNEIAVMVPTYVKDVVAWWNGLRFEIGDYVITMPTLTFSIDKLQEQLPQLWENVAVPIFGTTVGVATSIVSSLTSVVLGLVFSIYLLASKETLKRQATRLVVAVCPVRWSGRLVNFAGRVNRTFTSFVTGQLTEAVILGALCFLGMLILRLPYASLISVMVSVTALVPIFGAWIGAIVGALLILMVDPMKALWFLVFLICLQQFEGNVIYPHVVGKSVGLPGIWVFASVTLAASAFGFLGMMLCVPISAIGYELLRNFVNRRAAAKEVAAAEAAAQPGAETPSSPQSAEGTV